MKKSISDMTKSKIVYPLTVDECLEVFSNITYDSDSTNQSIKLICNNIENQWSIKFNRPKGFNNPSFHSKSPLEVCHMTMEFMVKNIEKFSGVDRFILGRISLNDKITIIYRRGKKYETPNVAFNMFVLLIFLIGILIGVNI